MLLLVVVIQFPVAFGSGLVNLGILCLAHTAIQVPAARLSDSSSSTGPPPLVPDSSTDSDLPDLFDPSTPVEEVD